MNRREVIKSMGFISLHALYPSILSSFLASCSSGEQAEHAQLFFDGEEQRLMAEVADIILPKTSTKSASEAEVPRFLDEVFAHCLNNDQKMLLKDGIGQLKKDWEKAPDKTAYLTALDAKAYKGDEAAAWFKTVKQCTLVGFFTSEEGSTRAGDYQKFPDRYQGDEPADASTLAHTKTSLRLNL